MGEDIWTTCSNCYIKQNNLIAEYKGKEKERKQMKGKKKNDKENERKRCLLLLASLESSFLCSHLIFTICGKDTEGSISTRKGY